MQLRATFKALYTIIFYDHRKNVEQLLREYDSVMPPLLCKCDRVFDSIEEIENTSTGMTFEAVIPS